MRKQGLRMQCMSLCLVNDKHTHENNIGTDKYEKIGAFRESNSGPLAPKARIIPLDQMPILKERGLSQIYVQFSFKFVYACHIVCSSIVRLHTNDQIFLPGQTIVSQDNLFFQSSFRRVITYLPFFANKKNIFTPLVLYFMVNNDLDTLFYHMHFLQQVVTWY